MYHLDIIPQINKTLPARFRRLMRWVRSSGRQDRRKGEIWMKRRKEKGEMGSKGIAFLAMERKGREKVKSQRK